MALIDDAIGHWTLNDTPNATIGPDATWTGTPSYSACKFGNGADIDSANPSLQHLTAPDTSGDGTFDPNDFAEEIWCEPSFAVTNGVKTSGGQSGYWSWTFDSNDWVLFDSNPNANATRLVLDVGGTVKVYTVTTGFTWNAGSLNHILIAYKRTGIDGGATVIEVYLNGVQVTVSNSTSGGANQTNTGGVLYFGTFKTGAISGGLNGCLDNVKIYNNVDSTLIAEILANRDNEGFPSPTTIQQYNFHSTILLTQSSNNPILLTATMNSKILKTITVDGLIN